MTPRQWLSRRVVIPAADRMRGRSLSRIMAEMERTQWLGREELLRMQNERLRELLRYAYQNVPYYRDLLDGSGTSPEDIRSADDLRLLPLLDRDNVRAAFPNRIVAQDVPRNGWGVGRTGGSSTGEPLSFMFDRATMDYGRAVFYRGCHWAGGPPGTPTLNLWGAPLKRRGFTDQLKATLSSYCLGIWRVDAFRFDDETLARAADLLVKGRIRFVYAYVSALEELCRFMMTRDLQARGVTGIMTTAEVLRDPSRALIEGVINAPIFNAYACGEINGVAYECDHHAGLHVGMERAIVEIVDDAGQPVPPGMPGRIALTDLHNRAMPLIRYLNGDEARLTADRCACGRESDRLVEILGRTCDVIDAPNGRTVHSSFFEFVFGTLGWSQTQGLTRFQIVQEDRKRLTVNVVMPQPPPPDEQQKLRELLTRYLGLMEVAVVCCRELDASTSGKLRWTINRLRTPAVPAPSGQLS